MDIGDAAALLAELAKRGDQEAIDALAAIRWPSS